MHQIGFPSITQNFPLAQIWTVLFKKLFKLKEENELDINPKNTKKFLFYGEFYQLS